MLRKLLLLWCLSGLSEVVMADTLPGLSARTELACLDVQLLENKRFRASYRLEEQCSRPAFPVSPYIVDQRHTAVKATQRTEAYNQILEGEALRLTLDTTSLCLSVYDKSQQRAAGWYCPGVGNRGNLMLEMDKGNTEQLYGLGQQHPPAGISQGDWLERGTRVAGSRFGNQLVDAGGGLVGNTQFPVLYALGKNMTPWSLFLDNTYRQNWDFRQDTFNVHMDEASPDLRFYVQLGESLADLRRGYMALVGKPLVPPRKLFGLWVSEFGYDNWAELDNVQQSLLSHHFPLDGFIMDLQWFGGIRENADDSRMGALSWNETQFPDPAGKIKDLAKQHIGLVLIEESYVSRALPEHKALQDKGYLVKNPDGTPVYLDKKPWWGKGGMLDWSNPKAAAYWHDWKRQPLVNMGILGHWTDLGEPMDFSADAVYHGFHTDQTSHTDVHNIYNLLWHSSIFAGYQRNQSKQRPFILSRSGGPGMQRYGAGMWSGDIPARLDNLAAHLNAQMQMSLSGVDYFGSDAGGFYRNSFEGTEKEYANLYTRWFAVSALLDLPLRPHADNVCNCYHTAPDQVGDLASNLANTRLRYELIPYYYSLAHHAYRNGDPIIAPALYADEHDPTLRGMGTEKLLGQGLLMALETRPDSDSMRVYLPKGEWFDYRTHVWQKSQGQWLENVPLYQNKLYRLPLYAKAGAIIPLLEMPTGSVDAFGRSQGQTEPPAILKLKIFPHHQASTFTVYEDDGESTGYQQGQLRTTLIRQQREANHQHIWIEAAQGNYPKAPSQRDIRLVVAEVAAVKHILLDNKPLAAATDQNGIGWQRLNPTTLLLRLPASPTQQAHHIDIQYHEGQP